jgi:poly-gamma-glutamate synthesis protein (capsule biosynthesis protein)
LLIGMVGDLLIDRDRPDEALDRVTDLLAAPDIMFGNLEANFTDDPHMAPSGGTPLFPGRRNLDAFTRAGFTVLSLANNHIVDAGHAAMLENRAALRAAGVATCGAGETIDDARRPAIIERDGVRIAFLAYASVFPMGYEARSNVPGLAPMRAYDFWRNSVDNYHTPGVPPRAQTVPDESDLAQLAEDITAARQVADLVVASFHWGDFMRPFHLTDHEMRTARHCVDLGVDMVIGHHHHMLRGIEWYRGKPIFYGLGHFVFDTKLDVSDEMLAAFAEAAKDPNNYGVFPREGWPLMPLHPDARMTVMAWARASAGGIAEVGFVPCMLRPDGRVEPVDPASDEGRQVIAYVERCNASQGLDARIAPHGTPIGGHAALSVLPPDPVSEPLSRETRP